MSLGLCGVRFGGGGSLPLELDEAAGSPRLKGEALGKTEAAGD